jgi:uncharacterized protein (DUF1810 family)
MSEQFSLQRFLDAQEGTYEYVCEELRSGRKRSHWMWFIFPQIHGLGRSATAERFAISGRDEAEAYLEHPVLGARLRECVELVIAVEGRSAEEIFGFPDYLKFRSCMTLFAQVEGGVFVDALSKYFEGQGDLLTLERL